MSGYAALSWYELPETREIIDRMWAALARHLGDAGVEPVPVGLTRSEDPHEALSRADLTLAQICGYVAGGVGRDRLMPVATLRYRVGDCEGSSYRSLFVARAAAGIERLEQLAGARAVINDPMSHSGCNALRRRVSQGFFASIDVSGSHVASLDAVREARADVAAIDCITWALLSRYRPAALEGLTVFERSPLAPTPPLVTGVARAGQLEAMRAGLRSFFGDPETRPEREALLWEGFEILEQGVYQALVPGHDGEVGYS